MPPINPDDPGGGELPSYDVSAADADSLSAAAGWDVNEKVVNKGGTNVSIIKPGSPPFNVGTGSPLWSIFNGLNGQAIIRKGS